MKPRVMTTVVLSRHPLKVIGFSRPVRETDPEHGLGHPESRWHRFHDLTPPPDPEGSRPMGVPEEEHAR